MIKNLIAIAGFAKSLFSGAFLWGMPYPPPKQNFDAKVLNFAVLSFGPRILSFSSSFKFKYKS